MIENSPRVVIIAGPNGAGKSTAAPRILRDALAIPDFVNADEIAKGLSAFDPKSMAIQAGRIMLERLDNLSSQSKDFAFETTLASRAYTQKIKSWKTQYNYTSNLIYFWINDPKLSVKRVSKRVMEGGHHVPTETIIRRYDTSLRYLFNLYMPVVDQWRMYDNSDPANLRLIARQFIDRKQPEVFDKTLWDKLRITYAESKT